MNSQKKKNILYWVFTIWMSFGMAFGAVYQLMHHEIQIELFTHLGYPTYLLTLLGLAKLSALIVILLPKFSLLKEWAYAGLAFTMIGAFVSHLALGDPFGTSFPPVFMLVLIMLSWYLRPSDRKLVS